MHRVQKSTRIYDPAGMPPPTAGESLLVAPGCRDPQRVGDAYRANPSRPAAVVFNDGRRLPVGHRYSLSAALVLHRLPTCKTPHEFITFDDETLTAFARHCDENPGQSLTAACAEFGNPPPGLLRLSYLLSGVEAPELLQYREQKPKRPPLPTIDPSPLSQRFLDATGQDPIELLSDRNPHRLHQLRDHTIVAQLMDDSINTAGNRWFDELRKKLYGHDSNPWRTLLILAVHGLGQPTRLAPYDLETTCRANQQLDEGGWKATGVSDLYKLKASTLVHGVWPATRLFGTGIHVESVTADVEEWLGTEATRRLEVAVALGEDEGARGKAAFEVTLTCHTCGGVVKSVRADTLLASSRPPMCTHPGATGRADHTLQEWCAILARQQSPDARLIAVQLNGRWYDANTLDDATPIPMCAAAQVRPGYADGSDVTVSICEIRRLRDIDEPEFARFDRFRRESHEAGVLATVDPAHPAQAVTETCLRNPDHVTRRRGGSPRSLRKIAALESPCADCEREARLFEEVMVRLNAHNSGWATLPGREPAYAVIDIHLGRLSGRRADSATIVCCCVERHLHGREHYSVVTDIAQMPKEPCGACRHGALRSTSGWWSLCDADNVEFDLHVDAFGTVTDMDVWHVTDRGRCPSPLPATLEVLDSCDQGCASSHSVASGPPPYAGFARSLPEHQAAMAAVRWLDRATETGLPLVDQDGERYQLAQARVVCGRTFDGCDNPAGTHPLFIDVTVEIPKASGEEHYVVFEIDGREHWDRKYAWDRFGQDDAQYDAARRRDDVKDGFLSNHAPVIAFERIRTDDIERRVVALLDQHLNLAG